MTKIDISLIKLMHIDSFKQLFHCRNSITIKTAVIKRSTIEQKMFYSEQTFMGNPQWVQRDAMISE